MKKKIIIISTCFIILFISLLFIFLNNNKTYKYDDKIISNSFEYEQSITNESIESIYYYSDSYFKDSSKIENEHLRTFAFSLVASFNPTYRKDSVNYNLNKILEELNFNDITYYDLEEFNMSTIGTSISHKKLNDKYELVVIVLRGADYQGEWESNLDVGENGNAYGFDNASSIVLSRLEEYLNDYNINNYKLLVTGYSRSAAVSGLVGVHLNNDLTKYNIDEDDLYVYSFEAPRYSSDKTIYKNIHNVINKNDIVTYVYPESWGLYHSGVDEDITTDKSEIKEKYLDILSSEKIKDLEKVDKQRFIMKFVDFLPNSRSSYYEVSDNISNIYSLLNSKTSYEKNTLINYFKDTKIELNLNNSITLLSLLNSDDEKTIKKAFDSLLSNYDNNYSKIKNVISEKEYNDLKEDIYQLFMFIRPSIKNDYNANNKFSNILTFTYNVGEIFKEHYFSVNYDQVKKKDSYYNENA